MKSALLFVPFVPLCAQDLFLESGVARNQKIAHKHLHKMLKTRYNDEEATRLATMMAQKEHLVSSRHSSNLEFNDSPPYHTSHKWIVEHKGYSSERGFVTETMSYTSPVIKLKPGEAHFTLNDLYHVPMPEGDYVVLKNHYDMVNGDGTATVPSSDVYPHHWLVGGNSPLDMCDRDYFWGGGAEFHMMHYEVPVGFGMTRVNAKGWCGANMHIINTQNLKTQWDGLNDPSQFPNPLGAARKNCIECGYAPNRAAECTEGGDGAFECCFTMSRCPVENQSFFNKAQAFRFAYELEITRNMSAVKPLTFILLDAMQITEGNIAPNHNSDQDHTHCDDVICNTTRSWTVGGWNGNFGSGICPGTFKWSYLHQHVGAINGTFSINGRPHCSGYPEIGTDPSDPYGNEQGYITSFSECVNATNNVRLNDGDVVTVTSIYDVDVNSTRNYPLPSGKHGGVMALFFGHMDCDPGTFGEIYICRDSGCIPTYDGKVSGETTWAALSDCQAACV